MPAAAPRRAAPSSNVPKLPALQAAPSSASSASGRAGAMGIRESRLPELAPRPQGTLRVQDRAARAESRGPVLQVSSTVPVPPHARPKQSYMVSLGCAAAGSPRIGVQLTVRGHHASTSRLRTPARSAQVLATKAGEIPAAQTDAREGTRDTRSAATPCFVSAQKGPEEQAGGKERDKEPLPTLVPEDAGNSASPKAAHSPGEASNTVLFPRACEGGEREGTATTMPEFSRRALGVAPGLQSPRQINQEASGYSPVHPAIRRVCDEEGKEQMSSCNISWPNNVSTLRLLRPQAADDSASAADAALGMFDICTTSRVEGQLPPSSDSQTRHDGVQDVQRDLQQISETETAGPSSADPWRACLAPSDEAEAVPSTSHQDVGPRPAGQLEPLRASVPEDAENSGSSKAVPSPVLAIEAPFFLSLCLRGKIEGRVLAMPEYSRTALGHSPRRRDPKEIYGEAYRYPTTHPAIQRIHSEARKEQMMSTWRASWPKRMRRLPVPPAAGDCARAAASAATRARGMLDICCTTLRVEDLFPASHDSQNLEEEETSDSTASNTSTDDSMLDARDSAVMAESVHVPSFFYCACVECVEEEREGNCGEDAAEAARVAPSISGCSSGEVKTRPSASPVAADPRPVRQSSTCEGAEAAAYQQEDSARAGGDAQSSRCFRDAPEDGPGAAAAPRAAARRRLPAAIRTALRALRRAFTCSCITGQREERHEAASMRQLLGGG
ncbi:uncharacterized protein LOC110402925 isoform X2 [Numida meleagris]|uniref:uncharacterized protein LOC110402925 isoform X2 n=1 Tax=Numida meleagris TaxID=8996 RepID=UPI000B3DEC05|nr:uncharacterized protein LOC110402925 isoform X2 [Numida meleagris]